MQILFQRSNLERSQSLPPHSVLGPSAVTVCGALGVKVASVIARELSSITVWTVLALTLAFNHSSSGTAINLAEWSSVLFRIAFPFQLTPYKIFSSLSCPRRVRIRLSKPVNYMLNERIFKKILKWSHFSSPEQKLPGASNSLRSKPSADGGRGQAFLFPVPPPPPTPLSTYRELATKAGHETLFQLHKEGISKWIEPLPVVHLTFE